MLPKHPLVLLLLVVKVSLPFLVFFDLMDWWLLPATITASAFGFASLLIDSPAPGLSRAESRICNAFFFVLALAASLACWLVWALVLR